MTAFDTGFTLSEIDILYIPESDDVYLFCCMCNKEIGEVATMTGAIRTTNQHIAEKHINHYLIGASGG